MLALRSSACAASLVLFSAATAQTGPQEDPTNRSQRVPVELELSGIAGTLGDLPPLGSAGATAFPACALALRDQGNPGCLRASSDPTLGMLYPLSTNLFVEAATGEVGVGTTSPVARLHVAGSARIEGDLSFQDDDGTLRFPAVSGTSAPMIEMFALGTSNPDRMVLGHSPSFPTWGLEYLDFSDTFRFRSNTGPTLDIGLDPLAARVTSRIPLEIHTDQEGISALNVFGTAGTYAEFVEIERCTPQSSSNDAIDITIDSQSSTASQYIECGNGVLNPEIDFRVDRDGEVFSDVGVTVPADFAEMIHVSSGADSIEPGDLVAIDPTNPRAVVKSTSARSTFVLGVYSTKPGVVGSEREWDVEAPVGSVEAAEGERIPLKRADMARLYDEVPIAMIGIVPAKVSVENGPIQPGDLLVTSSTPGHAMRDDDPRNGTIVGKALEPLANGTGKIRIAVTLQ